MSDLRRRAEALVLAAETGVTDLTPVETLADQLDALVEFIRDGEPEDVIRAWSTTLKFLHTNYTADVRRLTGEDD